MRTSQDRREPFLPNLYGSFNALKRMNCSGCKEARDGIYRTLDLVCSNAVPMVDKHEITTRLSGFVAPQIAHPPPCSASFASYHSRVSAVAWKLPIFLGRFRSRFEIGPVISFVGAFSDIQNLWRICRSFLLWEQSLQRILPFFVAELLGLAELSCNRCTRFGQRQALLGLFLP